MPMNENKMPDISIVIPCYNEEPNIPILYNRLAATLNSMPGISLYEIILIENGSHDNSWALIKEIIKHDPRVKGYKLSRNFGYQAAVTAGMKETTGLNIVVMDGDLQDIPEFIPELWNKKQEGFNIVYAVRVTRKEGRIKIFLYKSFYRIMRRMVDIDIPLDAGDFSIYDRKVINWLNKMPEKHRFIRGLRAWTGFSHTGIPYDRQARSFGKSKFNLFSMSKLASDGIFSFSYLPLRALTFLGLMIAIISTVGIVVEIILKIISIFTNDNLVVKGTTQIIVLIFFFGGLILLGIGILGEYLARIYEELKNRPLYIIEESFGESV